MQKITPVPLSKDTLDPILYVVSDAKTKAATAVVRQLISAARQDMRGISLKSKGRW